MAKITNNKQMIERGNVDYMRSQMDTYTQNIENSKKVQDSVNNTVIRARKYSIEKETETKLKRAIRAGGVDPYDNTPGGTKIPKDKLMSLSNSAYTSTLLEKILKASDNTQFQNTSLKFQEQALNYMQTISADIKTIAETLKPKEGPQKEEEDIEVMQMSGLAKALSGLDIEGIAREIGKSIYSKVDSYGYGSVIASMYQSMKETIQDGEFSQMVKGMIQNTMLSQLPKTWQDIITQFRQDPVKLMQLQLNKLATGDNAVLRDIFGSAFRKENVTIGALKREKIDMSAKAVFDNKFYTSVTKVIPEQLYRIVAALEGTERREYDWDEQDYLNISEIYAKTLKNNWVFDEEAVKNKTMDIFSYMFSSMQDIKINGVNFKDMFKLDDSGKIEKDQITGHVKFINSRYENLLVKINMSGLDATTLLTIGPNQLLNELGIYPKNDVERGQVLNDLTNILRVMKKVEDEERTDVLEGITDFREAVRESKYDNRVDSLTKEERRLYNSIFNTRNGLTTKERENLLNSINKRGIHTWSNEGLSTGLSNTTSVNVSQNPPSSSSFNSSTTTNAEHILNYIDDVNNRDRRLSDRDVTSVREFIDKMANNQISRIDPTKERPKTDTEKYRDSISELYRFKIIDKSKYEQLRGYKNRDEIQDLSDRKLLDIGEIRIETAYKWFAILSRAGWTAEAKAAELGISIQQAKSKGFISNAWELIPLINNKGGLIVEKAKALNMKYLMPEELAYLEKLGNRRNRSVIGSGSIDQQISKTLSGIFGDPKIANKAGMTLGGAAGLGIHKFLQSAGIMQDPRFGYLLGGIGAGLMTMERSRNFMDNVFGPAGDVKGANGFTNKEIFAAKLMSKYLPMIGVGGKTAHYILKASSAFGPFGKAMGIIPAIAGGLIVGKAASSALDLGRRWLFETERDKDSKITKFADFLKEIPGVKKLFALSDNRMDEEVELDALKRTRDIYQAKLKEARDKSDAENIKKYKKVLDVVNKGITQVERHISVIKSSLNEDPPNDKKADAARKQVAKEIAKISQNVRAKLGDDSHDTLYKDQLETQYDIKDRQNNMRSAADASYNSIGEERREKIEEIISEYYEASDDNKTNLREALTGDGDLLSDIVRDKSMYQELEYIIYKKSNGEDVTDEYEKWLDRLKIKFPDRYKEFVENTTLGARKLKAMNDIITEIKAYMINEEGFTQGDTALEHEAHIRLMSAINNKRFGRNILNKLGESGNALIQQIKDNFNFSINDRDDRANEIIMREYVDALMNTGRLSDVSSDNNEEDDEDIDLFGGGRGTEPVKMKQMSRLKFSNGESLGVAGCSVAALTNALVYMGIDAPEPDTLIGIANQYLGPNGGVTSDFFKDVCSRLGISVSIFNSNQNTFTVDTFRQFKVGKDNGLIVLLKNQFNSGYHFITVKSITGRNLVIDDPETVGVQQVTTAEIISRAVEIISLKAQNQSAAVTSEEGAKPSQFINPNAKKTVTGTIKSSIKNAVSNKIADMASNAISKATGVATTVGSKWNDLINALSKAVFNVRIVDDYTLPLKMDDKEAALAVSRMQTAAASAGGLGPFVKNIKRLMMNKDVQNEMEEADLMQETIINGGLVAGGSTGAAGRGTAGGAVARENNRGGVLTGNESPASGSGGFLGGLAAGAGNLLSTVAMAIPGAIHFLTSKISKPLLKGSWSKIMQAKNNLFGTINPEEAEQKFDENGNQIQRGKWRDLGGSLRNFRDGLNLAKGAAGLHALVGKGLSVAGNALKNTKYGAKIGKALTGTLEKTGGLKWLVNLVNDGFGRASGWIVEQFSKSGRLLERIGGQGVVVDGLKKLSGMLTNFCKKMCDKVLPKFLSKVGGAVAKGGGSLLKKLTSKIPGALLVVAAIQLPLSGWDGWSHAYQYLDRNPDTEPLGFFDRIKVALAKVAYDCLPEVVVGIMTATNPVMATVGDIAVSVVRSFFVSFDQTLVWFGFKKETWKGDNIDETVLELSNKNKSTLDDLKKAEVDEDKYQQNMEDIKTQAFTARHEGFSSEVYTDTKGKRTIGYGFNLDSGRFSQEEVDKWNKYGISKEEADKVLKRELDITRNSLTKYSWFNKLDPVRQGAIVDMAYNMGEGDPEKAVGLLSFRKMIAALESGDYATAAKEVLNSKYAQDVKGRAIEIANLIRFGELASQGQMIPPSRLTDGTWLFPSAHSQHVVTSAFGMRDLNVDWASEDHAGLDLRAPAGTNIYAAKDGKVIKAGGPYNMIIIKHPDGTESRYLHNERVFVKYGQEVKQGDVIGIAGRRGKTGDRHKTMTEHLHFEILKNGKHIDPFIELGLDKSHLKPNVEENESYLLSNPWLNKQAKNIAMNNVPNTTSSTNKVNKEAGGPSYNDINYGGSSNTNQTIINRDSQLERYVASLDAKFSQMIDLLSKLVNISQENINNVLSDAIAPARI